VELPILVEADDTSRERPYVVLSLKEESQSPGRHIPWSRDAAFRLEACLEDDEADAEANVRGLSAALEKGKRMLEDLLEAGPNNSSGMSMR
jgi:hypothetical protein